MRFRVSAGAEMMGATTAGSVSASSGGGGGAGLGSGIGTIGGGSRRTGSGLLIGRFPSRNAFGGGAF